MATSFLDLTEDEDIFDALRQRKRGFTLSRELYYGQLLNPIA